MSYGSPVENKVQYEVLRNSRNKGHTGSTRFVDMELNEDSSFNNYYWMEGPFPGDQGRWVLVLHSGQAQQCSNCLEIGPNCPAAGNGGAFWSVWYRAKKTALFFLNQGEIVKS